MLYYILEFAFLKFWLSLLGRVLGNVDHPYIATMYDLGRLFRLAKKKIQAENSLERRNLKTVFTNIHLGLKEITKHALDGDYVGAVEEVLYVR